MQSESQILCSMTTADLPEGVSRFVLTCAQGLALKFLPEKARPKNKLSSLKNLKHSRNASTSSLLSMDDPGINTGDYLFHSWFYLA